MTREEAKEFIAQSVKSDVDMALVADALKVLEQKPTLDELRAEITTLQNRCYALTKGTMCVFCKYECEYKTESEEK